VAATWNVKGLTEEKLVSICNHMRTYDISIICLQETRASKTEYYSEDGFKVILSSSDHSGSRCNGVGFIVAPWCCKYIYSFFQYSDRLASIKIKTYRGTTGLFCCYAPHNLKHYDERLAFHEELSKFWERRQSLEIPIFLETSIQELVQLDLAKSMHSDRSASGGKQYTRLKCQTATCC
jgi:exonuclease III